MGFRMLLMVLLLASSCAGMRMTQTARIRSLRAPLACRTSTLAALSDDDEELDAEDTVDSWDAQLAEMEAWAAQQKAQETSSDASSILDSDTGVDEDAHFGLGDDDDDEDAAGRALRQLTEKQASLVLRRIEEQQAAQSPTAQHRIHRTVATHCALSHGEGAATSTGRAFTALSCAHAHGTVRCGAIPPTDHR